MPSASINNVNYCIVFLLFFTLIACAPKGRYQQKKDSVPSRTPTLLEQQNAIPRAEPKSRGGNKNYTVRGKNYTVLNSAKAYKETGIASFYGEKFHGHLTSNGEIYNMFSMSAAHKSLPLPTYVKVTNLTNKKTAIVRVNDRGPFHQDRIIDLSYSAAYKLGISGVAKVLVEAITVQDNLHTSQINEVEIPNQTTQKNISTTLPPTQSTIIKHTATRPIIVNEDKKNNKQSFIQVFVTSKPEVTQPIVSSLKAHFKQPIHVHQKSDVYHILMGPFSSDIDRIHLLQQLKTFGYNDAFNKDVYLP